MADAYMPQTAMLLQAIKARQLQSAAMPQVGPALQMGPNGQPLPPPVAMPQVPAQPLDPRGNPKLDPYLQSIVNQILGK